MLTKYQTSEKGFTLIELLIVVAIIGILAAIAIPQFAKYKEQGYIASMKSDVKSVATAEEAQYAATGTYLDVSSTSTPNLTGMGTLSPGNTVVVGVTTGPPDTYKVTVSSAKYTDKDAVFNSSTGTTVMQ